MLSKSHLGPIPKLLTGMGLLFTASVACASPQATDVGSRSAPKGAPGKLIVVSGRAQLTQIAPAGATVGLSTAIAVASRLGRVTSTIRTSARNRAVRGARNSYHLRGRALDVVPRAGVRHSDIEAALRTAGLDLVESLDEGDHSHFAFGTSPAPVSSFQRAGVKRSKPSHMVTIVRGGNSLGASACRSNRCFYGR